MKKLSFFIKHYLLHRPYFYAFIRPQEALLFYERINKMKGPILDFGCGDGFFAAAIFKKKSIDVGLDLVTSRIAESRNIGIYKNLEVYDGVSIPFGNRMFGTIISNCVFEHVPHIEKSVEEMWRVTKKGGLLMTTVMCSSWSENLAGGRLFGSWYTDWFNRMQHHDALFSKEEWTHLFKNSGYEVIESVDYLYKKASQKTEIYHFISFLSLLTYLLFKRWNLFSFVSKKRVSEIEDLILKDAQNPSACFFVLKKI